LDYVFNVVFDPQTIYHPIVDDGIIIVSSPVDIVLL